MIVDNLVTLKANKCKDPTQTLGTVVSQHYQVTANTEKEKSVDWRSRISVRELFENHRPELIERLKKFESIWNGHPGTIKATKHCIKLTKDAKLSF